MNKLPQINDFDSIVLEDRPLIDVRAPVEFAKGAFPNSINLPLMNNEERHLVGICYKQKGNTKAVELGHKLVGGDIKEQRVEACIDFIKKNPDAYLYCFRGGQRSQIMQEWLADRGVVIPRLKGGYKAFRNYLSEKSISLVEKKRVIVLGGRTGSGKTILLQDLDNSIDLEGLANHRGSSFGRHASQQPSQIDFENALAYEIINHSSMGFENIIIEDESRNIGRCYIPDEIFSQFSQGDVVLLHTTLQERIDITYDEYIIASQSEYSIAQKEGFPYSWIDVMHHNFKRISKRLGDKGYRELSAMLESAWKHQLDSGDPTRHKEWIEQLLHRYYDPMYDYQIEQKRERIAFEGDKNAVIEYLSDNII